MAKSFSVSIFSNKPLRYWMMTFDCELESKILGSYGYNAVKHNLTELTTKSACVSLRVTCQRICLCQRSFEPSDVL